MWRSQVGRRRAGAASWRPRRRGDGAGRHGRPGRRVSRAATPDHRSTATVLTRGLDDLHGLGVSGTQGLVRDADRVTVARSGVADLDTGAPMPVDGSFRIGSTTKTFVSVVVLQLVGEGRIRLDDPIERWLPGVVSGSGNDGRYVSVRHSCSTPAASTTPPATSPPCGRPTSSWRTASTTTPGAAGGDRDGTRAVPAGTGGATNTNYLAGRDARRTAPPGTLGHTEVRSRLPGPLRLTHTFYPASQPTLPPPHANGYRQFAPGGPMVDTTVFNPTVTASAGGLGQHPHRPGPLLAGGRLAVSLLRPAQDRSALQRPCRPTGSRASGRASGTGWGSCGYPTGAAAPGRTSAPCPG